MMFNPLLRNSFRYLVAVQREEFARLYCSDANRIDGHHHMHLCANVLLAGLLPAGSIVRRNFSFQKHEKSFWNRGYRAGVDRMLARRHRITDFFFSLPPLEPTSRLDRIFAAARQFTIELETHPLNPSEYRFLTGGGIEKALAGVQIASHYAI
jgi:hypothetical protein